LLTQYYTAVSVVMNNGCISGLLDEETTKVHAAVRSLAQEADIATWQRHLFHVITFSFFVSLCVYLPYNIVTTRYDNTMRD